MNKPQRKPAVNSQGVSKPGSKKAKGQKSKILVAQIKYLKAFDPTSYASSYTAVNFFALNPRLTLNEFRFLTV